MPPINSGKPYWLMVWRNLNLNFWQLWFLRRNAYESVLFKTKYNFVGCLWDNGRSDLQLYWFTRRRMACLCSTWRLATTIGRRRCWLQSFNVATCEVPRTRRRLGDRSFTLLTVTIRASYKTSLLAYLFTAIRLTAVARCCKRRDGSDRVDDNGTIKSCKIVGQLCRDSRRRRTRALVHDDNVDISFDIGGTVWHPARLLEKTYADHNYRLSVGRYKTVTGADSTVKIMWVLSISGNLPPFAIFSIKRLSFVCWWKCWCYCNVKFTV